MAYTPYGDKHDYDIKALLAQIEEYKDVHGEECEYVRCEHRNADYSVLDRHQKAYYLFWRDELARGNCLKADRGYVKLRICEIINSCADPNAGMAELKLLKDNSRMHGTPESDILSAMFDFAITNDLELPKLWLGKGSVRSFMATSEMMSYPANRLNKELMWYLAGGPAVHQDSIQDIKHLGLFNDSLTAIDRFLHENTGKGIAKTYSEGLTTDSYQVFKYMPYGRNKDYQITYDKLRTDGIFGEFMLGLFTYTRKILCKQVGEKGPSTPSSFNKEFRAIVERIAKEGAPQFERIPKEWRGTDRLSLSSKEKALVDMGASLEAQYGPADKPKPEYIVNPDATKQHVSPHLKTDIERNWNVEVEEQQEYIPSDFTNPDYRSFKEPQRKYYVYWRGRCRKGLYGTTDPGYLWLYLCELINMKGEPQAMLDQLVGLYRSYGQFDEARLIGRTCFEYAVAHKLPLPDPSIYESNFTACLVMEQFLKDMDTNPDKNLLVFLSGTTDRTIVREFDADAVGITNSYLKTVEKMLAENGSSIEDCCNIEKIDTSVEVFDGLKYFREIRKARFSYRNYINSQSFSGDLEIVMKRAFTAIRMKRTNKAVKLDKFTAFGMDGKELMEKVVADWFENKAVKEIKERASKMKLDKEAVSGAESALKDVTEMMNTGYDKIEEEKVEAPIPVKEVSNSWSGLVGALDDLQKGYLKAVLKGEGKTFLKEKSQIMSRVEDSINGVAVDAVGDAIVEDGEVFEEYRSDLEAALQ